MFANVYSIKAQDYTPLLDDWNEWHFTTCYFGCLTDVYHTDGDTVVDGLNYKILDGFHYISRTFLLREDVAERKVYMTKVNPGGTNQSYLLYDFTLDEGDSLEMFNPISPFPPEPGYYTVDSIRLRPLVDGNDYRHFYFSPSQSNTTSDNNCIWVEGVGSLSLINAPAGTPDINVVGQLSCFFKNAELFYSDLDSIDSCDPLFNIYDITRPLNSVIIKSIEGHGKFEASGCESITEIEVFDLSGKRLFQQNVALGTMNIALDLSSFQSGMYFAIFKNQKGKSRSFKLIRS